jgi:rubredoxin
MGSKTIILKLLSKRLGKLVKNEDLSMATNIQDWPRQLRTLRQEGYDIEYFRKLKGYVLHSLTKKKGAKRRTINAKQRYAILKRNNFRCRSCGRGVKEGVKLNVDHKIPVDWGVKEHYENNELQTLCEECNLGKKNFYSDYDKEEIQNILSLRSGMDRLEALFKYRKGRPIPWEILDSISGIRDWERTLRSLRNNKKMNIAWNNKTRTYTFKP